MLSVAGGRTPVQQYSWEEKEQVLSKERKKESESSAVTDHCLHRTQVMVEVHESERKKI